MNWKSKTDYAHTVSLYPPPPDEAPLDKVSPATGSQPLGFPVMEINPGILYNSEDGVIFWGYFVGGGGGGYSVA